jgi:uncharacterized Zn ribbon protein
MVFIDYTTHNYCKKCEYRYSKSLGLHCPKCGHQARSVPRKTTKNKKDIRQSAKIINTQ